MSTTATEAHNLLNGDQPKPEIVDSKPIHKKSIKCRTVLWHVTFWGFVVNYMVRCNINMAIVSMVVPRIPTKKSDVKVSECFNHTIVAISRNISHFMSDEDDKTFRIERNMMDLLDVMQMFL